jgi:hypothetical protein
MTLPLLLFLLAPGGPQKATLRVVEAGRVLAMAVSPSERIAPPPQIAPGAPPLVSFRYFEGRSRHRYGDLDLALDDAGH